MANLLSDDDVFGSAPSGLLSDADVFGKGAKTDPGGFVASAKQAIGATVKGAGQAAADFIPGVSQENALKRYGQEIIEANPTAVHSFSDLADKPWTAVKEATGNALSSMGGVVGSRALGMGITAAAPFTGPAAPVVAGAGQAISWLGPVAAAALPSFGGIREQQIHDDPNAANSAAAKAAAAVGAGTVGAIESRFGPEAWGSKMLTEAGRKEVAKLFAAKTLPKAVAKGAVRGAAVEGAEELAQNPVEQLAAFQNPLTAEALKDTAFSGAMGALGGGVLGGGTGAASRYLPKKPDVDPGNQPAEPPKALPAPTYTGTPGDQTLQATVDRQNAVDAAQAAADAPIRYEPGLVPGVDVGGPTEPPSPPGGGIDFTPPQLPDTGPLSRAANLALGASVPMERQAFFPFQSFAAAERMRNGRDDLVTRQHPSIPGRFTLVPAGLETPVARQAKPDVQQGTGSFSDQNELANFIADERKDQSARKAALAEGKNNAIAQADQAVADARQFATRNERLSILDGVLSSLAPGQNPNRRFDAALKAAGFRDTSFTEEERAVIGRYGNVASAFAVAPEASVEPSSPGEIEAAIPAAKGKGDSGIAGVRADRVRSAIAAGFTQRKGLSLINPATGEKFALKTPGMIRAAKEALEQSNPTTEIKSEAVGLDHESGSQQRPDQDGSRGNMPTVTSIDGGDRPASGAPAPGSEPAVSVGDGSERNAALSEQKSTAKPRRTRMTPLDDPRISKHAESLQAMAGDVGWAEVGGRLIRDANGNANARTRWIPHAEWFRAGMIGSPEDARRAVAKAVSGTPMSVKEKRTIQGMMDWLDHVDAHPNEAEALADMGYDELTEPEQEARDALGDFDLFNPPVGDVAAGMRALGFTEEEIRAEIEGSQSRDSGQGDGVDNGIAGRGPQESLPGRDETRPSASEGQGPDERPSLELERQTDQGLADKAAREQEPQEPTKEQADRERDAAPFSLSEQSQPKPQGVQSGLFTADGRVSVEAKQPEKPAEVTKPKNEQQEAAGLPAATDGGSRPVPAVSALEETFRPLIERLIRNKRVAKELGFDIDGAIAKAKAAMAGTKQMPGSFRALAKRAEKKGDTETAAILNQIADLNDGRKAKTATVKDSVTTESIDNQKTVGNSVDSAAHEAATSPTNDQAEPTPAQKEAGNYSMGHVRISGLDISIENPEGSTRSGTDKGGKPWSIKMRSHYGYILGTIGKDKDHIDVFVKPGTAEDYAGPVFIIDQKNAVGGFDEHKVMLGWGSQDAAVLAYKANYTPGWDGIQAVTPMSMEQFKGWLENGNHNEPAAASGKTPLQQDIAKLKPNVELKKGDLIGASQEESDAIASKIEEKRRQLVEIEDRIVGAAGLASGFIEDAMRSRKVPSSMKEQREAIRAELADMRKQHAAVTAADRLLASKGGLAETKAEAEQSANNQATAEPIGDKNAPAIFDIETTKGKIEVYASTTDEAERVAEKNGFTIIASGRKSSESVPESLLDQHNATMAKLTDGTLSLDQYRAAFATIVENKDAVFAELSKLTKDAIFKRFRALFYRYKNDPKPEIIKAAYRSMMDDFVLSDSIQWSMGQKYEDVIRGYVDAATPESLAAYAEKLQAASAERQQRRQDIAKAIANPKTLDDYRRLLQAKVDGGKTVDQARMELTPEQRVAFDTLLAEDTRGRRSSAADARKTDVQVAARTTSGDIIETKHTKTGEDLFVVKAAERVERDVYNEWNASAKRLGGRYSSFRGNGAVPGFQFKSRENAVAFLQYLGGDVSAAKEAIQERRDAFADDRSQSAVERLNEMADRLEERADESLAVERKANTARRARFAASAEAAANGDKAMARTMRNIADAIADGTAKFLDRVRQKVQVEMLRSTVASAKYDELRQKYPSYVDQEKHRGEKPTAETADYARWPRFTADRADLARLGRDLLQIDGAKQLGNSILKVADDVTEAYKKFAKENLYKVSVFSVKREGSDEKQMAVFPTAERAEAVIARSGFKGKATTISFKRGEHLVIMGPEMAREAGLWHGDPDKRITLTPEAGEEIVAKVKALGKGKVAMPYVFENVANERARWKAIGIETAAEQRAALREFIALQEAPAAPDRIKQMEREMIGRKNDGLDFFPTPAATAQAMIEAADIKEGMSVLEPSAGMGHIAEQIRDVAGVEPDVIEFSGDRRELLEAKGFNVVGSDFMDMNSRGFTYGDVFRTPDGTLGVMRGSGGLGSNRVGLDPLDANGQPDPRRAIWTDRDELVGVEKRASNSGYDRIIMNPPFSNRRDAEHVQHAYSLLKPGGRLVAIMGEGVFYGQDKKAQAFRDWMESVGGTSEKLEEGTFLDPSLPVNTGVNARMVVIDKSGNGAPQALESRAPSFDSSDAPQTTMIRRVVDSFLAHFKGAAALDIRVVASRNDIPQRYRPSPYAEGVYHDADGVVYLISSNLPTQARAWQVLMHEAIGHYGLSNLMGEKFAALQSTVLQKARTGRELSRHPQPGEADYATVEAVRRLYPEASDAEVAQEVLARMAEMMDPPGWSKILFAQVRHWLRTAARAMNLTVEPSLQEAKDAVVLAAKHLRDGKNLEREMAGEGQAFASEGAPRLAPNGKPSRLNAHQWKQVRTPEFKAWFGDWEASAILNGEPLTSMKTADAPSGGFKAVEDWAASLFAEQGGVAVREGLGEVLLDRRAAKTSMAHGGANQYKKVAFAAVKDVIERGALVHRTANGDVDSFYFSAPVDIDGVNNIETVLVHRDANTGRMYLHSVMAKESLLNHQVSRADAGASERSGSTDSEGISRILQDLVRRNGVSKVVDENGEPRVVYHGTNRDFNIFKTKAGPRSQMVGDWDGVHFTNDLDQAQSIADSLARREGGEPKVVEAYLLAENPTAFGQYRTKAQAEAKNHDSRLTENNTGLQEWTVFSPTQIKSATGNNGNFSPANPDIRESRSSGPAQWQAPEPSRLDDLIYSMQDKHVDMKRVVQSIKQTAGTIADNIDPYLQEELFHGRAAKAVKDFLDLELRPLIAEMRMRGVEMADFEEYLWNRHAEERNAQIAKINPQMEDGGSGLKTADAQAYLAGLSSDKRKAYESLAAKIDAITARNRQVLVDSGLEKAETVAAWEGAYKHYVLLQREDVETGGNGTGQGFSVRGTSSKRAVGSGRPVADIIANLAMQRERFIVKAEKNRVSIAIAGLAVSNPNPDFWKIDDAPKERVVETIGGQDQVVERTVPSFRTQENVVHFRLNGEDHFVIFNEREPRAMRMAQSIKNLDMDQLGRVLTVAGKVTRYFAAINTQYNPIFGIINLFRDVQGALLNLSTTPLAGEQKRVAGYTVDALRGIYADIRAHRAGKVPSSRWASLYEEFQNEGGQTGYRDQFSNAEQRAEAIAKEIRSMDRNVAFKAAGAVFDWLSDYNQAMENAVRLAAYAAAKERGLSKQQAASLAKNLTVNFNRKGQVATQMGALYAFFNASMQGTARLAQTLTGPMGRRIITGGILLGSMQALLLASAGMGDDEPPEFVRERNLILPIGDGKYISLPMPLGFHVLPNLGRIPVEFVMSGFREPARRISDLVAIFADTFNPIGNAGLSLQTIAPTVVDPFAALAENKDWTGKPIAKMDMNANSPTPGHSRAKDTSTVWSKSIAEAINYLSGGTKYKPGVVSPTPDQIDYLIGQVTGGVGREAAKAEQTVTSTIFTGEELPLHKVPLVGRFVGDTKGQSAEGSKFYAALQRINEHENEIKGMRKDGRGAEIAGYIQDNPEARLMLYSNHVEREVQKLRAAKRDALERGDEGRVRMIESALTAKMRAFNERVRSAQGSAN